MRSAGDPVRDGGLTAQVGVGLMTAAAVLAYLPAGVLGNPKAAAAYAGVHPAMSSPGNGTAVASASRAVLPCAAISIWRPGGHRWDRDRGLAWPPAGAWQGGAQRHLCRGHKLLRQLMGKTKEATPGSSSMPNLQGADAGVDRGSQFSQIRGAEARCRRTAQRLKSVAISETPLQ